MVHSFLLLPSAVISSSPAIANADSAVQNQVPEVPSPTKITSTTTPLRDPRPQIKLRLNSINEKAGLELFDVTIGNPSRTVPAIKRVISTQRQQQNLQPGMILLEYPDSKSVVDRIRNGPYPIDLTFYNLAAGGDAFGGDMGKPLVTAEDALKMAQDMNPTTSSSGTNTEQQQQYVKRTVQLPPICRIKSRRGDVVEINYEARMYNANGPIYDSSEQRGTGLPYQFVLGSGDMIPGVDLGLYEACPGETRVIEIPPSLAYGARGSKLFRIPGDTRLVWTVEVVAVNQFRQDDDIPSTREELEGREL